MTPEIKVISEFKIIGKKMTMSFANNLTAELWKSFMPIRKQISGSISADVISLQIYPPFFDFNPTTKFEKWAGVEVENETQIPQGMEVLAISEGTYAVFHYKGLSTDTSIFEFIFKKWLPSSGFVLDDRPHFERLGEKYKNGDLNSEEDIFIPVRKLS
jgi:AraC family transcriptional regulator